MGTPEGLFFSNDHEWIRFPEEGRAVIGITDFAQQALGDILFVNLCAAGDSVKTGDALGDVESIKSVSEIISPISGVVTSVNEKVLETPDLINRSPYDAWLIEMGSVADTGALITADEYEVFTSEQ